MNDDLDEMFREVRGWDDGPETIQAFLSMVMAMGPHSRDSLRQASRDVGMKKLVDLRIYNDERARSRFEVWLGSGGTRPPH